MVITGLKPGNALKAFISEAKTNLVSSKNGNVIFSLFPKIGQDGFIITSYTTLFLKRGCGNQDIHLIILKVYSLPIQDIFLKNL